MSSRASARVRFRNTAFTNRRRTRAKARAYIADPEYRAKIHEKFGLELMSARATLFQNPSPKCIANVTGLVAGPPVGRLNRTGKSASTKYALKNPLSVWIGQLLFTSGVNPNCDELTSNAPRIPTPMSCPTLQTPPG